MKIIWLKLNYLEHQKLELKVNKEITEQIIFKQVILIKMK
jgi:hypothetical protein